MASLRKLGSRIKSAIRGSSSRRNDPQSRITSRETIVDADDPDPSATPGAPCIVLLYGEEIGRKHTLERGKTTIGRAPASDVRVDRYDVASTHAVLTYDDHGISIASHDPGAVTWVDDRQIDGPTPLRDGDLFRVGRAVFKLLTGREGAYHEELWRLATTDELTEVYNRKFFVDALDRALSFARRRDRPLSLLLVVPDRLEHHHETLGHRLRDHVLRELATVLRERTREGDTVARYRDDTFAVLMPELDLHGATRLAETLRESIGRHRFELDGHRLAVTVSVGAAELASSMTVGDALVDAADARLRQADAAGGDRVASSDPGDAAEPPSTI
jgi:diguanylate cyclase (GGDEF)-like protein